MREAREHDEKREEVPRGEREDRIFLEACEKRILSEFRIEVGIELGTVSLTLEQLFDLANGQRWELSIDEREPLRLMVDGEHVASGIIVSDATGFSIEVMKVVECESFEAPENSETFLQDVR